MNKFRSIKLLDIFASSWDVDAFLYFLVILLLMKIDFVKEFEVVKGF